MAPNYIHFVGQEPSYMTINLQEHLINVSIEEWLYAQYCKSYNMALLYKKGEQILRDNYQVLPWCLINMGYFDYYY